MENKVIAIRDLLDRGIQPSEVEILELLVYTCSLEVEVANKDLELSKYESLEYIVAKDGV